MSIWYKDDRGFTRDQTGGSCLAVQGDGKVGFNGLIGIYDSPSVNPFRGYVWLRNSVGKRFVWYTAPASGGGPFTVPGNVPHFNILVSGLTTAAGAISSAITVNNTTLTGDSRIQATIINYAGTWGTNGVPVVCLGAITSGTGFTFQIYNAHGSNALSGVIKIAFTIEN